MDLSKVSSIVVVGLKEHDEKYHTCDILNKQFTKLGIQGLLRLVMIEKSFSQPDTVSQGIKALGIKGPVLIKDSDNFFIHEVKPGNFICYAQIADLDRGNPTNKSYLVMNEAGFVINIVEKKLISDCFCCGAYGFTEASQFVDVFERCKGVTDLYISHLIYQMILEGQSFVGCKVKGYLDWGTLEDWNQYRNRYCTLFIDVDGTLVENSAEYFPPFWGETGAIKRNVEIVNKLYESGYGEIILITSRSEESRERTLQQIEHIGLKFHRILFGLLHAKRIVINDYSDSNPYRSCDAINLRRNSEELTEMLNALVPVHS